MVEVTKLNGEKIILNFWQIKSMETIPETKVTLMSGDYYLIRETAQEVCRSIQEFLHGVIHFA